MRKPLDGGEDLPDLVGLGHAALVLDVDPRVAGPRGFENQMAARLPGLVEVAPAQPLQVADRGPAGIATGLGEELRDGGYGRNLVSLLILVNQARSASRRDGQVLTSNTSAPGSTRGTPLRLCNAGGLHHGRSPSGHPPSAG